MATRQATTAGLNRIERWGWSQYARERELLDWFDAAGCEVAEHRFPQQDRWAVRERATLTALNTIRLRLLR